jgi:hypothetical protein
MLKTISSMSNDRLTEIRDSGVNGMAMQFNETRRSNELLGAVIDRLMALESRISDLAARPQGRNLAA